MSDNNWCTIESDPGVFTELIETIGVKDVQVEELFALDAELIQPLMYVISSSSKRQDEIHSLAPVYGLIFLFKWEESMQAEVRTHIDPATLLGKVFFANQVISNACATQAIISILLNRPEVQLGANLTEFKKETKDFPAQLKGLALGNNELIKKTHNSFSRPESITIVDKLATGTEDAYHFVAYLPIDGELYELDGLQKGPIAHGKVTLDNWLDLATPIIQQRIEKYSSSEIRFNLMAVVKNRKTSCLEEIASLEAENTRILTKLSGEAMDEEPNAKLLPTGEDALKERLATNETKIADLRAQITDEEQKFAAWREENIRRRHNYVPFLFNLLRILAERKQLQPLYEKAKQRYEEKKAAKKKAAEAKK